MNGLKYCLLQGRENGLMYFLISGEVEVTLDITAAGTTLPASAALPGGAVGR